MSPSWSRHTGAERFPLRLSSLSLADRLSSITLVVKDKNSGMGMGMVMGADMNMDQGKATIFWRA